MTELPAGIKTFAREFVSCIRAPDDVATVLLTRPRANALSLEMIRQIEAVAEHLRSDLPAAVVVWGGPKVFSAGADIGEMGGSREARIATKAFRQAFDAIESLPRIVIAAINGYALGGGFELALACDFRVAGRTAKVGLPEIQLGLLPGAGGTQRLPRLVGTSLAKQLILTGRAVLGGEACSLGLVDRLADDDEVLALAQEWAAELATGPQVAQGVAKELLLYAVDSSLEAGLSRETDLVVNLFDSADAAIGIRSFLQHGAGKAAFTGQDGSAVSSDIEGQSTIGRSTSGPRRPKDSSKEKHP